MKKQLLLLLIAMFTLNGYSQISFEKGYYITNSGDKIECLIKNIDWNNNPTNFDYKLSEASDFKNAEISTVKEFGIYNYSRFVRSTVKIDKSTDNTNELSYERNPTFVEEQLFLKVLVEGKANLYLYENSELTRFFYNIDNSNIELLVYKRYLGSETLIKENNQYKQQLTNNLNCSSIELSKIEKLQYKKNVLTDFFTDFNKCSNSNSVNYESKVKKDLFNLAFRVHLNNSSLSIQNSSLGINRDVDFGNKFGIGFGIETEFILPFNKNKWAIVVEPTYQSFKAEKTTDATYVAGGKITANVNYSYIDIPVSIRHYFFLNKNSKIFVNASYPFILDFVKSSIDFTRVDGSNYDSLKIKSENNLAFGLGYKFMDKYILEVRTQTTRSILGNNSFWGSEYRTITLLIGYSIF